MGMPFIININTYYQEINPNATLDKIKNNISSGYNKGRAKN